MRKNIFFLLLGMLFALPLAAQVQKSRTFRALSEILSFPLHALRLGIKRPSTLNIEKVSYGTDERQYMLICESKFVKPYRNTTIFYVHGGGWSVGKPEQHLLFAEMLARQGYRVILPAYRLLPKHTFPDMELDIDNGFRAAQNYLQTKHLPTQMVVGGVSAGGSLASILALNGQKDPQKQADIVGLFAISAVLDLDLARKNAVLKKYTQNYDNAVWQQANPISYLSNQPLKMPILCIHSKQDHLVEYALAESFVEKAKQAHQQQDVRLYTIEKGKHIAVSSKWYYKPKEYAGQLDVLLQWLNEHGC